MDPMAASRYVSRPLRVRLTHSLSVPARFCVYGAFGMAGEIFFYNLVKIGRQIPLLELAFRFSWKVDPQLHLNGVWDAPGVGLFGQSSLWMFFIYAAGILLIVEPVYRHFCRLPVWARAFFYAVGIMAFEWITGWAVYGLTGYRIWYYDDPLSVGGMTSLYLLPTWMVAGLLSEGIYRQLMAPELVRKLEGAELEGTEELAPLQAPAPSQVLVMQERAEKPGFARTGTGF